MRKIKFRQWDKKLEAFLFYQIVNGHTVINDIKIGSFDIDRAGSPQEQFTGLYDNKNTEIYEGDIVIDHIGKGVVKYVESKAAYRVCYGDGYAKWFEDYTLRGERESIEVIGNTHTHPELLKD